MMYKININGNIREMEKEEATEFERMIAEMPPPEPTPEEEIKELKEKLKAAEILLGLEV